MKFNFPHLVCLGLAAGVTTAAFAQSDSDIPVEYFRPQNYKISVGVRIRGKVSAKFGNLGTVPAVNPITDRGTGKTKIYDNGTVVGDSARAEELDPSDTSGNTHLPVDAKGYYATTVTTTNADGSSTTVQNGSHLAYVAGQTRTYTVDNASQISPDGKSVTFNSYDAKGEGGTAQGSGGSGGGVEIQLERTLGKLSKRVEVGLLFSIGVSDINAKSRGTVRSTLHTVTDTYAVNAGPNGALDPTQTYTGPTFTDYTEADGTVITPGGIGAGGTETTKPLYDTPTSSSEKTEAGKALIDGFWQIKGAYYMLKLGPDFRVQFTEKFAVSFGGGVSGAYVGSKFRIEESIDLPDTPNPVRLQGESLDQKKFIPGYYADLNAEWWVTQRTGFFAGVTYEKAGSYDQSFMGRTAKVDISSGGGFRFGLTTRF